MAERRGWIGQEQVQWRAAPSVRLSGGAKLSPYLAVHLVERGNDGLGKSIRYNAANVGQEAVHGDTEEEL